MSSLTFRISNRAEFKLRTDIHFLIMKINFSCKSFDTCIHNNFQEQDVILIVVLISTRSNNTIQNLARHPYSK